MGLFTKQNGGIAEVRPSAQQKRDAESENDQ